MLISALYDSLAFILSIELKWLHEPSSHLESKCIQSQVVVSRDTTSSLVLLEGTLKSQFRIQLSFQGSYWCSDRSRWPLIKRRECGDPLLSYGSSHSLTVCRDAPLDFPLEFRDCVTFCHFTYFILLLKPEIILFSVHQFDQPLFKCTVYKITVPVLQLLLWFDIYPQR